MPGARRIAMIVVIAASLAFLVVPMNGAVAAPTAPTGTAVIGVDHHLANVSTAPVERSTLAKAAQRGLPAGRLLTDLYLVLVAGLVGIALAALRSRRARDASRSLPRGWITNAAAPRAPPLPLHA